MRTNVHNLLYSMILSKRVGRAEVLKAFDMGYVNDEEASVLLNVPVSYTLEEAIKFKKEECSYICQKNILSGIDVVLSDGNTHHFSLSEKDQINLSTKMLNIAMGATSTEYHSDGEPCVYYNVEDMTLICVTAQVKVTAETTYYNCLTQWIKNCKTADEVMAISYGVDIPEEYQSEPWKDIVKKMNGTFDVQENDNISNDSNKDDVEQTEDIIEEENNIEESVEE